MTVKYLGNPCNNDEHLYKNKSYRYIKGDICVMCRSEDSRKWRERNRESYLKKNKEKAMNNYHNNGIKERRAKESQKLDDTYIKLVIYNRTGKRYTEMTEKEILEVRTELKEKRSKWGRKLK